MIIDLNITMDINMSKCQIYDILTYNPTIKLYNGPAKCSSVMLDYKVKPKFNKYVI